MTIYFPRRLIAPQGVSFKQRGRSSVGPASTTGLTQSVSTDAGYWSADLQAVQLIDPEKVKLFRSIMSQLDGTVNSLAVPVFDYQQAPWELDDSSGQPIVADADDGSSYDDGTSHDDGAYYEDFLIGVKCTGDVDVGETVMDIDVLTETRLKGGEYFSVGDRLYVIEKFRNGLALDRDYLPQSEAIFAETTGWSDARKVIVDSLIRRLADAGIWAKLGLLYVMGAHSDPAARINWINPGAGTLTDVDTPASIFAADQGFTGNASTGGLATGVNLSSIPGYAQDDAHVGVWVMTNIAETGTVVGTSGGLHTRIIPRDGSDQMLSRINSGDTDTVSSITSAVGHWLLSRSGAAGYSRYHNGVSLGDATSASVSLAGSAWILRDDTTFSTNQVSIAHWGSHLSASEVEELYDAFTEYLDSLDIITDRAQVVFWPQAREAIPSGTYLNFDDPRCKMKLADESAADLALQLMSQGRPDLSFVEDLS